MDWRSDATPYQAYPSAGGAYYNDEGSDGEETPYEEEEVPQVSKQNFKDLLQQYDQMLVAQGVLPAFMLESQQALPDQGAPEEAEEEYSDLEEEEQGEEQAKAADEEEDEPTVQPEGPTTDALGAWVSTYQPRTFGQKKRNARRRAKTEGQLPGPLNQPPYLEVERKVLHSLWNIESGASSASAFRLVYSWLASYSQVHPSEFGDHLDLFYLFFNLLINGPETKEEDHHNQQHPAACPSDPTRPYRLPQEEAASQARPSRVDVDAQLQELAHIAAIFSKGWALGSLELLQRLPATGERSDEFIGAVVNIVSLLLQDGVSVLELRKLFRTILVLNDRPQKSVGAPRLLDQVGKLLTCHHGPTSFFEFNAATTESGLLLPSINQWPANGFTFSTWLWVDSFSDPAGKPLEYFPYLFSFSGEHGQGLELSFHTSKALVFKTFWKTKKGGDNARIILPFDKFTFETKRWYFLTLIHTRGSFVHGSVVDLYINTLKICSTALSYPRFEEAFTLCTVGSHIQGGQEGGRPGRGGDFAAFHSYQLHGRMSAFMFFDAPLQTTDVKSLYVNCYRNDFLSLITKTELGPKVFIGYAPRAAASKNSYMEILPSLRPVPSSEVPARAQKRAEAMAGTSTGPFHIALQQGLNHILKGVPFVLMLLHKLCTSSSSASCSITRMDAVQQANLQITIECFLDVINLLGRILREDLKSAERELISNEGFTKLAAVLSRISPSVWNAPKQKALDALYTLTQAVVKMGQLTDEMFKRIYLNFDIWIYTSSVTQHALLDLVTTHVVQQPQHFKRLIGIKGVLDILRSYYWYSDRSGRSYLDRSLPNDVSDTPTPKHLRKRRRLSADEVKGLRQRLLSWIQVFIQTRETPSHQTSEMLEDVRSIFTYIQFIAEQDPLQLLELLPLVSSLLRKNTGKLSDITVILQTPTTSGSRPSADSRNDRNGTESDESFAYGGQIAHCLMQATGKSGLNAFIGLLKCTQDESVRVWILRVLGDMLNCLNEDKKLHLLSGRALQLDPSQLASIKAYLQSSPITPTIYAALMALLLGSEAAYEAISSPPTFSPARPSFSPRHTSSPFGDPAGQAPYGSDNAPPSPYSPHPPLPQKKASKKTTATVTAATATATVGGESHFRNAGVIPLVFELVVEGGHGDPGLHTSLLRDFLFLLVQSQRNRTEFLEASLICPPGSTNVRIGTWQWKAWLFGLLGKNNALFPQILDFFVTLLNHIISAAPVASPSSSSSASASPSPAVAQAKNHLRETQSLCKYFGEKGGFFDWANFCGHLHKRLLSLTLHTIRTFDPQSLLASLSSSDIASEFSLMASETAPAGATITPPLPPRPSGRSRAGTGPNLPPRQHQEAARRELERERERRERQISFRKEKEVEEAASIVRARNWLTWLKLVEEYIFYSPSPSAIPLPRQSDPFFQALHYNEEAKWEDLRFGQETLRLIDTLTQKIDQWRNAYGASPNPSVEKIQRKLQAFNERFAVRLALTTLHEADCSLINEKETIGVGSLESLESIVRTEVAAGRGLSGNAQNAILTATADYLALKRQDLYTRTQETEQIYQGCIERLGWRFVGAESQYDLNPLQGVLARYFVIGFLFRAMKHSHENSGGRGAKIILPLFKSLLIDLKLRCLGLPPPSPEAQTNSEEARVHAMIEQSKQVLEQLDDESLLPYFMKGLASGAGDFLLIGPMGAAIAHEHAGITRLSENLRQLLQDIEIKVLSEMQAKTSLEGQLRLEFGQLLDENIARWRDEEQKHRDDYETELLHASAGMDRKWQDLTSLFQGERALESSDEWRPYTHEIAVPPFANPSSSSPSSPTDLPPAILLTNRNTYLPRQEGQILLTKDQPPAAKPRPRRGPEITHIFVWERVGLVNLFYDDHAATLHPMQEGDGRTAVAARKPGGPHQGTGPGGRAEFTVLPDRNASRGQHYYSHLMMMPTLASPSLSSTALSSPPIALLPMSDRSLALIHGANWDNSVVVGNMEDGSAALRFIRHRDVVTCLSLSSDGHTLLTGSKDATLIVWNVQPPETKQQGLFSSIFSGKELPLPRLVYKFTLVGHDDVITCCDYSTELNMCASGSNDGSALVFDLDTGAILASLYYGGDGNEGASAAPLRTITHIKLIGHRTASGERVGKVVSYCGEQKTFYLHALDGRLLAIKQDIRLGDSTVSAEERALLYPSPSQPLGQTTATTTTNDSDPYVRSMLFTRNGRWGISGRSDGLVVLWNLDDLSVRDSIDVGAARGGLEGEGKTEEITAMGLLDDRLLLVGLKSGVLKTFPLAL